VVVEKASEYRALAQKMLEQAKRASDEDARAGFLRLAASWHELADKVEAVHFGAKPETPPITAAQGGEAAPQAQTGPAQGICRNRPGTGMR
jgi:hypothetical protein